MHHIHVISQIPSHPHTLTPSIPTSSHPHIPTSSHPHILTVSTAAPGGEGISEDTRPLHQQTDPSSSHHWRLHHPTLSQPLSQQTRLVSKVCSPATPVAGTSYFTVADFYSFCTTVQCWESVSNWILAVLFPENAITHYHAYLIISSLVPRPFVINERSGYKAT